MKRWIARVAIPMLLAMGGKEGRMGCAAGGCQLWRQWRRRNLTVSALRWSTGGGEGEGRGRRGREVQYTRRRRRKPVRLQGREAAAARRR